MVLVIAYVAATLLSYRFLIAPWFGYAGLHFDPRSYLALIAGLVAAIAPCTWIDREAKRPSAVVYYMLYSLLYIPACIIPACCLNYNSERYVVFIGVMVFCFWLLHWILSLEMISLTRLRLGRFSFTIFIAALAMTMNAIIVYYFGIKFSLPSFADVYHVRADFSDMARHGPNWLAYAVPIHAKAIAPCAIVWGLISRRYSCLFVGVMSQMLIYAHTGHKTVFLSPVLLIAVYLLLRISRRHLLQLATLGLTGLIVLTAVIDVTSTGLQEVPGTTSVFVRRMMVVPGQLSGYYFDFFSENPKAKMGHSVLRGFVSYPYHATPPRLIMLTYFGDHGGANAGLWSDGYANFGYVGMVMATVILGVALLIFDSVSQGVDNRASVLLLLMPAMAIVNSAVTTVLLTHGLVFAILLLAVFPADQVASEASVDTDEDHQIRQRRWAA